jgi:hypothetical protein
MHGRPNRLISILIVAAVATAAIVPAGAQTLGSRAEYEACQTRDEAQFRSAIEKITHDALLKGTAKLDYAAIVADEWRRANVDDVIDKRVDLAVAEVKDETSWGKLLSSLANKEKAQELATAVAERVYRSDAVKTAIEGLASGVGREVGKTIEIATIDAGGPAIACLKAFLGPRYGAAVARAVTADAGKQFAPDAAAGGAKIAPGAVLADNSEGIAGAIVLLVRRQLANLGTRIGQRVVGSILSRLVSVVAGGVGVALIAKDIWDMRHGVMPIIATEMKSRGTKDQVQAEIAKGVSEQIGEGVKAIATATSEKVGDIWGEFKRAHARVLDLAEKDEKFKAFLDGTAPDRLARLDEAVGIVIAGEGEPAVLARLADGTLQQAVNSLPAPGFEIARETRSLASALAWWGVAQADIAKVVTYELHRRAKPDDYSRVSLQRLLALGDAQSIQRLGGLPRPARDVLFSIDDAALKALARGLGEAELETLARYLVGLEPVARGRVLTAVAGNPAKMQVLASARVRDSLLASRDQGIAVDMMLRTDAGGDVERLVGDLRNAWEGRIHPLLLWEKHPIVLVASGLAALVLLAMLRRLLFPRRRAAA